MTAKSSIIREHCATLGLTETSSTCLTNFFGTSARYLRIMGKQMRVDFVRNTIWEIGMLQRVNEKKEPRIEKIDGVCAAMCALIDEMQESQIDECVRAHARAIPAVVVRKLMRICDALPSLDSVVEIIPHHCAAVIEKGFKSKKIRYDEIYEVYGLPNASEWCAAKHVSLFVINAINLRSIAQHFVAFAASIAQNNLSIFAIIFHDSNVLICHEFVITTESMGNGISMTIISRCEKKITSVLDSIRVE